MVHPTERQERSRYVVLHHTGYGEDHFDLMIESSADAAGLLAWRTPVWPLRDGASLRALGQHRRAYLDYEGRVSGGRGEVRRVARGTCVIASEVGGTVRVRFDEQKEQWLLCETARQA